MIELSNEEYEKGLVGSIIRDPDKIEAPMLSDNLFYYSKPREVYRACIEIIKSGGVLNLVTLSGKLGKGFASYVSEITNTHGGTEYYIKELLELSKKRMIMKLAQDNIEGLKDKSKNTGAIIDSIESCLLLMEDSRGDGYQKVSEYLPSVLKEIEDAVSKEGIKDIVYTGLNELDTLIDGLRKEEYVIIGARPGTGKTSISMNIAINASEKGKNVGIFSAEMSKNLITKRMLCSIAGVNGQKVRSGMLTATDVERLMVAAGKIYTGNIFIDDTPNIHMAKLVSEARRMRRREKIDILFVDYMSLITLENTDMPRNEQVAQLSRRFKQLSRELHIPIIVIAQLNRDAQEKRPTMANLRESGGIEQDADIIMLMWNRGFIGGGNMVKVTMIVEKNRNGAVGEVDLFFRPDITRFYSSE